MKTSDIAANKLAILREYYEIRQKRVTGLNWLCWILAILAIAFLAANCIALCVESIVFAIIAKLLARKQMHTCQSALDFIAECECELADIKRSEQAKAQHEERNR